MLYVGKFYKQKGIQHIIESYKQLKKKYDVMLILIGGSTNDECYEEAANCGARILPRMDKNKELPMYFSAADVYLMLVLNSPNFLKFGGIGIAPLESLACGTPVVSPSMRHFPAEDLARAGKIPKSQQDVARCVSEIFAHPECYSHCREIARKYYDWKVISEKIIETYDNLFKRYYN